MAGEGLYAMISLQILTCLAFITKLYGTKYDRFSTRNKITLYPYYFGIANTFCYSVTSMLYIHIVRVAPDGTPVIDLFEGRTDIYDLMYLILTSVSTFTWAALILVQVLSWDLITLLVSF